MNKDNFITFRVDDTEKKVIQELSRRYHKSRSEICRLLIDGRRDELQKYARRIKMSNQQYNGIIKALNTLRTPLSSVQISLNYIGNNMNQIARILNSGRMPRDVREAFEQMENRFDKVKDKLTFYSEASNYYAYGKMEDDDDG